MRVRTAVPAAAHRRYIRASPSGRRRRISGEHLQSLDINDRLDHYYGVVRKLKNISRYTYSDFFRTNAVSAEMQKSSTKTFFFKFVILNKHTDHYNQLLGDKLFNH